ncbi:MAG: hypothetical protein EU549_01330 [Promethearchaeota archaeon]|nr:MAG: hypothetical protein EU549_01330 [Candidatus Lokiarchaeota archaeon]
MILMGSKENTDLDPSKFELKPKLYFKQIAIKKIMLHAIEYSNPNRSKWHWREVMGLLGGKIEGYKVIITDSFAITHGSHFHVSYNDKNYIVAAKINSLLYDEGNGEFFTGWYHTHPGLGFFYSDTDIINHLGYQDVNPYAIGIVFDHEGYRRQQKFFAVYTLNIASFGVVGYQEIDYKIQGIPKNKEIDKLKEIFDRILFYWNIDFVESAEKTVLCKMLPKEK